MWLLELHIAVSVLCIVTFYGFVKVYKEQLKENGWLNNDKKKGVSKYIIFFVPLMNVLSVILLFVMIVTKKEDLENIRKLD